MRFFSAQELMERQVRILERSGMDDARTPGTATNLLAAAPASRLGEVSASVRASYDNRFVQNANGFYLDFHGEEAGLSRAAASPAVVLSSDKNLKFFTERGTLRDVLGSTIAAGTQVSDESGNIVYVVNATNVPAGVQEVYVTAVATSNSANNGNVGSRVLNSHNISVSDVQVTNERPILTGRSSEPDRLYRSRLLQHRRGSRSGGFEAIAAIVQAIPGVYRTQFRASAFGINHPAFILSGPERLNPSVTAQAEALTRGLVPLGTRLTFLLPEYRELDLVLAVKVNTRDDRATLASAIERIVRQTVQDAPIGQPFSISQLDPILTRQLAQVVDVEASSILLDGADHTAKTIKLENNQQLIAVKVQVELI